MVDRDNIYTILRRMIREEIDKTPGYAEAVFESVYPASVHAEKTILGAIILDGQQDISGIAPEDFSLTSHRIIFEAMQALKTASRTVDIVTLQDGLGKQVREVGGVAYLASLTEGLPRRPAIAEYIAIVKEKSKLRRIIHACNQAIGAAHKNAFSAEVVEKLGKDLKGIRVKA